MRTARHRQNTVNAEVKKETKLLFEEMVKKKRKQERQSGNREGRERKREKVSIGAEFVLRQV